MNGLYWVFLTSLFRSVEFGIKLHAWNSWKKKNVRLIINRMALVYNWYNLPMTSCKLLLVIATAWNHWVPVNWLPCILLNRIKIDASSSDCASVSCSIHSPNVLLVYFLKVLLTFQHRTNTTSGHIANLHVYQLFHIFLHILTDVHLHELR